MKLLLFLLIIAGGVSVLATTGHPENEVSPDKRIALGRGELDTAYPTWWGFNDEDATLYLQAAIDSPAKRVIVPNIGKPWIVRPIWLRSDLELIFEPGVEIWAHKGDYKWVDDCLFCVRDSHNITIRGDRGVVLKMNREDYLDPAQYASSEWRMGLSFLGCSDILVENLTVENSGGDGLYFGTSRQPYCSNVVVRNVKSFNNHRQGLSIISGKNILVENCEFSNTAGLNPQAGVDLEPNNAAEVMQNIRFRNVIVRNNAGPGFVTYLTPLDQQSEPVSITFENCIAENNGLPGFLLAYPGTSTLGQANIQLLNCISMDNKNEDLRIFDKDIHNGTLLIKGGKFAKSQGNPNGSILVVSSPVNLADVGGIYFDGAATSSLTPFEFSTKSGTIQVKEIRGNITTPEKNWDLSQYQVPPLFDDNTPHLGVSGDYVPVENPGIPEGLPELRENSLYLRSPANYVFYAEAGQNVELLFDYQQIGDYPGVDFLARIYSPSGKVIPVPGMPFMQVAPFNMIAPESGLYRVRVTLWSNRLQIARPQGGIAIVQQKAAQSFMSANGRLYLNVPPETEKFSIHLIPNDLENTGATLYDPSGRIAAHVDSITERYIMAPEHYEKSATDQTWVLDLFPPTVGTAQNLSIEVYGIPPFLATTPDGLLTPARTDSKGEAK